ncbi:MAG: hypothetical protein D6748_10190, partial [Calditrichaeota bacterium]
MNIFRLVFFGLTIFTMISLMELFIFRNFRIWVRATRLSNPKRWLNLFIAVLMGGNVFIILRFILSRIGGVEYSLIRTFTTLAGLFSLTLFLTFLGILGIKLFFLIKKMIPKTISRDKQVLRTTDEVFDPSRRTFLKYSGMALAGVSIGSPIIGTLSTPFDFNVVRVPLLFNNLPRELDGLTIAQISDIHSGAFMSEKDIKRIVDEVNSLKADLIVITGDFIDSADSEIPPLYRALEGIKADLGVFGCLGNHDHYGTASKVVSAIQQRGIRVLNNSQVTPVVNGTPLTIAGIDDAGMGIANYADFQKTVEGIPQDSFKILLSHRPTVFGTAQKYGFDLTLSGHTHGGQIAGEILGVDINPIGLFLKYVKGLYIENTRKLYV